MEKVLLLQILDSSWMEHLRAMDHLRSSVGLRGYAQVDPKVEYKREGMKIFEEMWSGVGDKVTDLIFRMEHIDPEFLHYLGARWQLERATTIHAAPTPSPEPAAVAAGANVRAEQDAAIAASQKGDKKPEPVRNTGKKIGRNDPCPCGSGKKYKVCCMRKANPPAATSSEGGLAKIWVVHARRSVRFQSGVRELRFTRSDRLRIELFDRAWSCGKHAVLLKSRTMDL